MSGEGHEALECLFPKSLLDVDISILKRHLKLLIVSEN